LRCKCIRRERVVKTGGLSHSCDICLSDANLNEATMKLPLLGVTSLHRLSSLGQRARLWPPERHRVALRIARVVRTFRSAFPVPFRDRAGFSRRQLPFFNMRPASGCRVGRYALPQPRVTVPGAPLIRAFRMSGTAARYSNYAMRRDPARRAFAFFGDLPRLGSELSFCETS
jgi:hypothetical protein